MDAIIFYSAAEYCNSSGKLTIKLQGNKIRTEIWDTANGEVVKTEELSYISAKKAQSEYYIKIGKAIKGGWNVLNAFPQRETWELKISK